MHVPILFEGMDNKFWYAISVMLLTCSNQWVDKFYPFTNIPFKNLFHVRRLSMLRSEQILNFFSKKFTLFDFVFSLEYSHNLNLVSEFT